MCRHEISADEYWEKYRIYRIRFHEEQEKHLIYMIKNHDNNEAKLKLKWFFKFILNVVFNKYYIFLGKIIIYDYLIHRSFGDEIFIDKNYYTFTDNNNNILKVNNDTFNIAESFVGTYFTLQYNSYIFGNILDVNKQII
jgi:hypothetical protein